MELLLQALPGVLVPAVIAGLVALAGHQLALRSSVGWRAAGAALGAAAGYVVAHRVIAGSWPPVPFGERTLTAQHWRFWAAPLGGAAGVGIALARGQRALAWLGRAGLAALCTRAVLDARFRHGDASEAWMLLAAGTLTLVALFAAVERGGQRHGGFLISFAFVVVASATALSFQFSRNSSNAQLIGAVAATAGAVSTLLLVGRRSDALRSASAVWLPGLGMAWLEGVLYGRLPLSSALLAAAALGALAVGRGRRGAEHPAGAKGPRKQWIVATLLLLGLASGAVISAWAAAPASPSGYPY